VTRRVHIAIVVVLLVLLVLAFWLLRPGSDETAPEQSTPPTPTATA
jgi:hypothetical protein